MQNHMEKKMEDEMETVFYIAASVGIRLVWEKMTTLLTSQKLQNQPVLTKSGSTKGPEP